jgi:hypothetical protein
MNRPRTAAAAIWLTTAALPLLTGGCPELETNNPTAAVLEETPTPDEVRESVESQPPMAVAGEDQSVVAGAPVTLNGAASRDPDGKPVFFVWQQIGGEPAVEFESGQFASIARFTAPDTNATVTLTFSLTVGNGFQAAVDDVTVTITPATP